MADDLHAILGLRDDSTRVPPPRPGKLHLITAAVLFIGAIVTLVAVFQCCHGSEVPGIILWALAPNAVFFAASRLARTRGRALATLIVSILATAIAAVDYMADAFGPRDPNEGRGLDMIFLPPFLLLAALMLLAVIFFTRARNPRSA